MPFKQLSFPFCSCAVRSQLFRRESGNSNPIHPEAFQDFHTHESAEKKEIPGFQGGRQPVRFFPGLEVDKAIGTKDRDPWIFGSEARNVDECHPEHGA